jgi:hypothetical protein
MLPTAEEIMEIVVKYLQEVRDHRMSIDFAGDMCREEIEELLEECKC